MEIVRKPRRIVACFSRSTRNRQLYFGMLGSLPRYNLSRLHYSKDVVATVKADAADIALLVLDYPAYKRLAGWIGDLEGYAIGVSNEVTERDEMQRKGLAGATFDDFRKVAIRLLGNL